MTSAPTERSALPNWLLPVAVCGAAPSLLFLLASFLLFVVWLFRAPPAEPLAAQPAAPAAEMVATSVEPPAVPAGSTSVAATTTISQPTEDAVEPEAQIAQTDEAAEPAPAKPAVADSGPRRVQILMMPHPGNVNLPMTIAKDYAYDHNTGRLGIFGPWEKAIGFISIDQQRGGYIRDIEFVQLRGEPHALTYHGLANGDGVFAIAQSEQTGIILVDAESLEIVKSLRVASYPTFMWAAGKSDDKYLYFTTEIDRAPSILVTDRNAFSLPAGWKVKMQRIDLTAMEFDTRFQGEEFRTSTVTSAGNLLVRFFLSIVYLDRDERFMACEDGLYAADDGRRLTDLKFHAQRFLPEGPWLTGVNGSEIVVGSINDGRIVAGVSLPGVYDQMLGRIREGDQGPVFAKIFLDLKRNLLVVGRLQHVIIIPLETLGLPKEPILLLDERPPAAVAKGALYEFPLRTVSGEGSFALVEGPEGMTIQDGVLRWRPEVAFTAPVEVKLKTSANDVTREETWSITVE